MTNTADIAGAALAARIREALAIACEHDVAACQARRDAGKLLATLRDHAPGPPWLVELDRMGLDPRTALLLVELAAGGRERTG
jgi:hypothetical protein